MQDLVMAVVETLSKIDGRVNVTAACPVRAARSSAKIKNWKGMIFGVPKKVKPHFGKKFQDN